MSEQSTTSGKIGIGTIFLIILASGFTIGICYAGYKLFMGEPIMPGIFGGKSNPASSSGTEATNSAQPGDSNTQNEVINKTVPEYIFLHPESQGSASSSFADAGNWFPLKRVTGSALHTSNPFVKDLQQYLNKFKSAKLDIDGAFGLDTETAVNKAFGTKQVSIAEYNKTIAPLLGKPLVN